MFGVLKITHLVRSEHVFIEDLHRNLVNQRVRNPGTVVSSSDLAQLVGAHFGHGYLVRLGVILDRNLGRHSSHGCDFTPTNQNQYPKGIAMKYSDTHL